MTMSYIMHVYEINEWRKEILKIFLYKKLTGDLTNIWIGEFSHCKWKKKNSKQLWGQSKCWDVMKMM